MKTPKRKLKYSTMSAHIKDAVKQGKENFIINLNNRYYDQKSIYQLSQYNSKNPDNKTKKIFIYKKGKLIDLLKNIDIEPWALI